MPQLPKAPAHLARYVDALGVEEAVKFLLLYGGAELHIAQKPTPRSQVVRDMGMDAAEALARVADYLPRRVPNGKPWIAQVLRAKDLSVAQIARRLHVSDVTVRRYLSDAGNTPADRPDKRQPGLFD